MFERKREPALPINWNGWNRWNDWNASVTALAIPIEPMTSIHFSGNEEEFYGSTH